MYKNIQYILLILMNRLEKAEKTGKYNFL